MARWRRCAITKTGAVKLLGFGLERRDAGVRDGGVPQVAMPAALRCRSTRSSTPWAVSVVHAESAPPRTIHLVTNWAKGMP
ncbi:MAG TPA: hypothetical protein VI670_06290 [Thermoanaerobaculia bacterium]|jgi:hypothetical protein